MTDVAFGGSPPKQKLDAFAVDRLDSATREVVRRLADPTRHEPYQSKGLVVGHVQSGKTANFTGVIAKAVDAGYRLVIVLTGTIEILRSQTQRLGLQPQVGVFGNQHHRPIQLAVMHQ